MILAPEEVYLKKRTVVFLEAWTDAKGRAVGLYLWEWALFAYHSELICSGLHILSSVCRMFFDFFSFQILPNPDFAHLDSDKVTQHFHILLFDIVHRVGVSRF